MLKIKDNVDLKELEKYGFSEVVKGCYELRSNNDYTEWEISSDISWLSVTDIDKELLFVLLDKPARDRWKLDSVLYDLIKDGLVEKVEE